METRDYLRALVRGWYLILAAMVLGGALGYLYFLHGTPRYRATTTLSVGYTGKQLVDEAEARVLSGERARAFTQLAPTRPAVEAAEQTAGVSGGNPAVSAGTAGSDNILFISVVNDDPVKAAAIANAYAAVLPHELARLVGPYESRVRLQPLSRATPPAEPFTPRFDKRVGFGVLAGLGLGCIAAALRDVTDRRVRTAAQAQEAAGAALLGVVPDQHRSEHLPIATRPHSLRAEGYRHVRTAMLAAGADARVFAVTSARAGEGKTSLTTNVAISLHRSGLRVLLVDADLRRPRIATNLSIPAEPGLGDVLEGGTDLATAIRRAPGEGPDVLPAGRPAADPSELLASPAFTELVREVRQAYDVVLIDTPPVLSVTDGRTVAACADATVLVSRLGHVTPHQLRTARARLEPARVLGIVANGGPVLEVV